jgi:capsular polysaccharide biosynthesis protein
MHDDFSGLEFLDYTWRARRVPVLACGVALLLSGAITLLLPARYTATATILIEPPAGNDPRAATAVSTVYLDSLKTYEQLVSADRLFVQAIEKVGIRSRYAGSTVEELKRKMLVVSKPVNTSLIEVSATLPDPTEAQRLAQTVAEEAVALNESLDRQSNDELVREPDRLYRDGKARRERADQAQSAFLKETSVLTLDRQIVSAENLRTQVSLDLAREKTSLAAYQGQRAAGIPDEAGTSKGWTDLQISSSTARIRDLERQLAELTEFLSKNVPSVEKLKRREEAMEAELHAARTEEEGAAGRLREIQSSSAVRRMRIKLLDPGIVPQRPSSPNLPLNLAVALMISLIGTLGWLVVRFAHRRAVRHHEEPVFSRV